MKGKSIFLFVTMLLLFSFILQGCAAPTQAPAPRKRRLRLSSRHRRLQLYNRSSGRYRSASRNRSTGGDRSAGLPRKPPWLSP